MDLSDQAACNKTQETQYCFATWAARTANSPLANRGDHLLLPSCFFPVTGAATMHMGCPCCHAAAQRRHGPLVHQELFHGVCLDAADDVLLMTWRKDTTPFLALPPPAMDLTGWRDPFVVEKPCAANGHQWVILIGSGIKNMGGTALVYRVQDLRLPSSWVYDGLLCLGEGDTGEEAVQAKLARGGIQRGVYWQRMW